MIDLCSNLTDMPTILFVINPISGGIDKRNLKQEIIYTFPAKNFQVEFFETTGRNDQQILSNSIDIISPDYVVACGGDGTINLVTQTIINSEIPLGIVPMGSANGLATEFDIPEKLELALKIVSAFKTRKIDVLEINEKYLSMHLADLGFNAKLIKRFEQAGKRGKLGYARQFIKTLFTQESVRYHFMLNDQTFSRRAQMVSFANARKYGTGAVINPDGKMDDGFFEICIFRPYPWYALFSLVVRFFTGSLKKSKYVKILSTDKAQIFLQKPETLQIDGETIGEFKEVEVKIHAKKMQVIVPAFPV